MPCFVKKKKTKTFFFLATILFPIFLIWWLRILAECNRAPFDFAEGESELVSGFNTEYYRRIFAYLFIGEYGIIIFFSLFTRIIFLRSLGLIIFFSLLLVCTILLIRSVFPRFRYDKLIFLVWFKILPVCIIYLGFGYWMVF